MFYARMIRSNSKMKWPSQPLGDWPLASTCCIHQTWQGTDPHGPQFVHVHLCQGSFRSLQGKKLCPCTLKTQKGCHDLLWYVLIYLICPDAVSMNTNHQTPEAFAEPPNLPLLLDPNLDLLDFLHKVGLHLPTKSTNTPPRIQIRTPKRAAWSLFWGGSWSENLRKTVWVGTVPG